MLICHTWLYQGGSGSTANVECVAAEPLMLGHLAVHLTHHPALLLSSHPSLLIAGQAVLGAADAGHVLRAALLRKAPRQRTHPAGAAQAVG